MTRVGQEMKGRHNTKNPCVGALERANSIFGVSPEKETEEAFLLPFRLLSSQLSGRSMQERKGDERRRVQDFR